MSKQNVLRSFDYISSSKSWETFSETQKQNNSNYNQSANIIRHINYANISKLDIQKYGEK